MAEPPGKPATYLLIESQEPGGRALGSDFLADAVALADAGATVRLVLVQGGVTAAVPGAAAGVERLAGAAGQVWVDDFALAQRGLRAADLVPGARPTSMDTIAAAVLDPAVRVVWH